VIGRRRLISAAASTLCLAMLGPACRPDQESVGKATYRVGYLAPRYGVCVVPSEWQFGHGAAVKTSATTTPTGCPEAPLLQALVGFGYRPGVNLEWVQAGPLTLVGTDGDEGDFLPPAAYLAAQEPDVIVADGERAARAAKAVTSTVPIVVTNVQDVVESGLVSDLARPGGHLTGVSVGTAELSVKRVELLKEAFPHVKTPILIYGQAPSDLAALSLAVEAANQLGLAPIPVQVRAGCDPTVLTEPTIPPGTRMATPTIEPEFTHPGILVCAENAPSLTVTSLNAALQRGADSVVVIAAQRRTDLIAASLMLIGDRRLPGVFPSREYESVGAISLRDSSDFSVQVATYVDRILRGASPGELPIMTATNYEIVVNLRAAEALGLVIARRALTMANTVIR